jgi:hypothetical protein
MTSYRDSDRPVELLHDSAAISTSGDNEIIAAPGAGLRIVVSDVIIQNESSTATTALVKNGATTIKRILMQNQGDGIAFAFARGREWRLTANAALNVNLSGANSVGVSVSYYLEEVS